LENEVKQEVLKLVELGVSKPYAILNALSDMGLNVPKKIQLNNFLQSERKKQSPPIVSEGLLQDLADNYSDQPRGQVVWNKRIYTTAVKVARET